VDAAVDEVAWPSSVVGTHSGACVGPLHARTEKDLIAIAACTSITDGLTIELPVISWGIAAPTSVSMPVLTRVTGEVRIGGLEGKSQLVELSLPVLAMIEGGLDIGNTSMTELSLPALTTVTGDVELSGNYDMVDLSLPVLTTVGGYFQVYVDHTLVMATLPELTTVGDVLSIRDNAVLASLSLPKLSSAGALYITENGNLTELNLPMLTTVTGEMLWIVSNPSYPACRANAVLAQVTSYEGTPLTEGNDETATCP